MPAPPRSTTGPADPPGLAAGAYPAVWLDSVRVRPAGDRDGDGYHSRLDVSLDADTDAGYAQAYASVALVDGHGRLAVRYDTDAFGIDGRSALDDVGIGFELLDDFPTGRYSLHVELRDARYGDVLDGVGAGEFASLGRLRLEGVRRDGGTHDGFAVGLSSGFGDPYGGHGGYGGVRDDGHATAYTGVSYVGALDPLPLLALGVALAATCRVRSPRARRRRPSRG